MSSETGWEVVRIAGEDKGPQREILKALILLSDLSYISHLHFNSLSPSFGTDDGGF